MFRACGFKRLGARVHRDELEGGAGGWTSEGDFQWGFLESAHLEHRESEDVTLIIHLFHHLVASGLPKVTGLLIKNHFQVIRLGVVPNLHFVFDHSNSPVFILSVN